MLVQVRIHGLQDYPVYLGCRETEFTIVFRIENTILFSTFDQNLDFLVKMYILDQNRHFQHKISIFTISNRNFDLLEKFRFLTKNFRFSPKFPFFH